MLSENSELSRVSWWRKLHKLTLKIKFKIEVEKSITSWPFEPPKNPRQESSALNAVWCSHISTLVGSGTEFKVRVQG